MNVVALIPRHQHPEPKVIVLQQVEVLVRTNSFDCGLLIHHAGMIKRIALLCKFHNFRIRLRWHTLRIGGIRISSKLFHDARADTYFWMYVEYRHLFFTAIRIRNIITVHSGNQFIFAMFDALIQCIAKSTVLSKANHI